MAKRYQIDLIVNTTQSDAATTRSAQTIGKVERAYQKAGEAQERAAKRAADAGFVSALKLDASATKLTAKLAAEADKQVAAQERAAKRAADAASREATRATAKLAAEADRAAQAQERAARRAAVATAREAKQAADAAEREARKAADAADREAKRAADASAREAKRAADIKAREAQRAQDRLTAMGGRLLTDEESRAKGQAAVYDRLNDRKIAAATKLAERERIAGLSVKERLTEGFQSFVGGVNLGSVAMTAGVTAVGVAVAALRQHWADVASEIQEAIKFQNQYREGLPENASVKGHLGNTTQEAKENLQLRSRTLQNRQESSAFEGAMLNTGNINVGSKISRDEFNRLKEVGGSLQFATGADAESQGELVGRLPALMKPKVDAQGKEQMFTADDVIGRLGKIKRVLDEGGAKYTVGSDQLKKNASLTQNGAFKSIERQAAIQSSLSLSNPLQAGEMTQWLARGTIGNLQDKEIGSYYKRIGHKDGMDAEDVSRLVSADLTRQETQAKAAGKNFDAYDYLTKQGFQNQEDIKGQLGFHAVDRGGELKKMMDLAEAPDDPNAIRDSIARGSTDARAMKRRAEIASDMAQFSIDPSHLTADAMRETVFNFHKNQPGAKLHGEYKDVAGDWTMRKPIYLQRAMNSTFQQIGKAHGMTVPELSAYKPWSSQIDMDKEVQGIVDQFTAAGINPQQEILNSQAVLSGRKLDLDSQAQDKAGDRIAKRQAAERQAAQGAPRAALAPGAGKPLAAPVGAIPAPALGAMPQGVPMALPKPTDRLQVPGGLGSPAGGQDQLLASVGQLVNLTQQSLQIQQAQQATLTEANRQRGQAKPQPIPAPLPVQGPGRIPTR